MNVKSLLLTIALLFGVLGTLSAQRANASSAVYDTIRVEYGKDVLRLTKPNEKGSCKAVMVYPDGDQELVNVSKSVLEYIMLCEENKIKPALGLKLRNGIASSLIKLPKRFTRR